MPPRILILSHVLPFPGESGQQQRVANTLKGLHAEFEVDFLTYAPARECAALRVRLERDWCSRAIVLPSRVSGKPFSHLLHQVCAAAYVIYTGLKTSNYYIGHVEFSAVRIKEAVDVSSYDLILFEYWHAYKRTSLFHEAGVPVVLDMHDILVHSYRRHLDTYHVLPVWWKQHVIDKYAKTEQAAWKCFDAIVAINSAEAGELQQRFTNTPPVFYTPMGIDTEHWRFDGERASPPRIVYYGGLGNPNNQSDALFCHRDVMPEIWSAVPEAEFWLLGSNPPPHLLVLQSDRRVRVPGYLPDVRTELGAASLMLCPFSGRFGFRSRVVEALALGVPVIASSDAVHGMNFTDTCGVFICDTASDMARVALRLLHNPEELQMQRDEARRQALALYGFDASYGRLARDLLAFVSARTATRV